MAVLTSTTKPLYTINCTTGLYSGWYIEVRQNPYLNFILTSSSICATRFNCKAKANKMLQALKDKYPGSNYVYRVEAVSL